MSTEASASLSESSRASVQERQLELLNRLSPAQCSEIGPLLQMHVCVCRRGKCYLFLCSTKKKEQRKQQKP